MTTQSAKQIGKVLKSLLVLAVFCSPTLKGHGQGRQARTPNKFLLPSGYIGWVRVDYGVKGAPPLPKASGYYVYRIPLSGYFKTSTLTEDGWATDEYYYVQGKFSKKLDQLNMIKGDGVSPTHEQSGDGIQPFPDEATYSYIVGSKSDCSLLGKQPSLAVGCVSPLALQAWRKGRDLTYKTWKSHNFVGMNLSGANLGESIFSQSNFTGVNLSYAIGVTSDFSRSNFQNANLYAADFHEADLSGANLRHANLQKVRLQGANLSQAKLQGANLRGAQYDAETQWPKGFKPRAHGAIPVKLLYYM